MILLSVLLPTLVLGDVASINPFSAFANDANTVNLGPGVAPGLTPDQTAAPSPVVPPPAETPTVPDTGVSGLAAPGEAGLPGQPGQPGQPGNLGAIPYQGTGNASNLTVAAAQNETMPSSRNASLSSTSSVAQTPAANSSYSSPAALNSSLPATGTPAVLLNQNITNSSQPHSASLSSSPEPYPGVLETPAGNMTALPPTTKAAPVPKVQPTPNVNVSAAPAGANPGSFNHTMPFLANGATVLQPLGVVLGAFGAMLFL